MPEQFGDKQHEATPYRRQQAREEGHVARSPDLSSAAMLVCAVALLLYLGQGVVLFVVRYTQQQLGETAWLSLDRDEAVHQWHGVLSQIATHLLPILGLLMVAAIVVHLLQVGFLFLPGKLALDVSRISPLRGLQRIFSLASAIRLGFGLLKILLVGAVAYWCLWGKRSEILSLSDLAVPEIARIVVETALWTCLKIGAALLVLALLDYGFQWWKHEQDLRMTTQEMREELKTLQGDPQIAAQRKAVQRQLALNRIGTAVPKASLVVTNPTELAIAIQYDIDTMAAPIVVAKGAGNRGAAHSPPRFGKQYPGCGTQRTGPCTVQTRRRGQADSTRTVRSHGRGPAVCLSTPRQAVRPPQSSRVAVCRLSS